jgi:hypothetical protein
MSLLEKLAVQLSQDEVVREEFYADPVAALRRAGVRLQANTQNALRGLRIKTNLKAGAGRAIKDELS